MNTTRADVYLPLLSPLSSPLLSLSSLLAYYPY